MIYQLKLMQAFLLFTIIVFVLAACEQTGGRVRLTPTPTANVEATEAALASLPSVTFVTPTDGATVSGPVQVEMTAKNFTIEPAGEINENAGHFHIMINTDCVEVGQVIPADDNHLHYGKAQTETELDLQPGDYTLCLQAANGAHIALDLTQVIDITVEGEGEVVEVAASADEIIPGWPLSPASLPEGDPERGAEVYVSKTCNACHGQIEVPDSGSVGPWIGDLTERGDTIIDGYTAADYLYESVLAPSDYIVEDCPTGPCSGSPSIMVANFGETVTDQELADLMAYILGTSTFESDR